MVSGIDIHKVPYDDNKVWELICSGFTCGVFQCESKLVQQWLKKIQPMNIWELSAVIAIVRPGALKSGFADEFVALRNEEKKFESLGHPVVDEIFQSTGGVLLYQESLMALGSRLAWSHLDDTERLLKVDALRKAVGKKNQEKLLVIGKEFVEGCTTNKIDKELADRLFEVIKNCGRYLFNLSHSIAYAYVAYHTAYLKCHYPKQFFATYLTYTKFKLDKWEELETFVNDARIFNIDIISPNINHKNDGFKIHDEKILFGLGNVKYVGSADLELIQNIPEITDWRQVILLCCTKAFGGKIKSTAGEALIKTNAFSDTGVSRIDLFNIFNFVNQLSNKELTWLEENIHDFPEITKFKELMEKCVEECCTSTRKHKVQSQISLLKLDQFDKPAFIEQYEKYYLGIPLTAFSGLSHDYVPQHSCRELYGFYNKGDFAEIVGTINDIIITKTKRGKNPGQEMALISVHDDTGKMEKLPVFPDLYEKVSGEIIYRNTLRLSLYYNGDGWIIDNLNSL